MISELINILFWNSRGLEPHFYTITAALQSSTITPQILIFTETHLTTDEHSILQHLLPDYQCLSYPHTSASGGILILIHNEIAIDTTSHGLPEFDPINTGDSSMLKWVKIRPSHQKSVIIGAVYLTPNTHQTNIRLLHQTLDTASLIDTPIFLVGDYNLHHQDWSNFATNQCSVQSQMFSSYINNNGWIVLNADYIPHIPTRPNPSDSNRGTIIDLAVTNADHLVHNLKHDEEWSNQLVSDHIPLILSLTSSRHNRSRKPDSNSYEINRFRIHKHPEFWQELFPIQVEVELKQSADKWLNLMKNTLQNNQQMNLSCAQNLINVTTQTVADAIIDAAARVIGRQPSGSYTTNHWFGLPGVKTAYKRMKASSRLLQRIRKRQSNNFIQIQQLTHTYQASKQNWLIISSKAKDQSWRDLCDAIQDSPSSKLIWSMFKRTRGAKTRIKLNSVLDSNMELPDCNESSLNNATKQLIQSAIPPQPVNTQQYNQIIENIQQWSNLNEFDESDNWEFTHDEIHNQTKHQRTDSAPGPDSISALLLKHGGKALIDALHTLYNFSWKYGVIPQDWTSANVALIPKSDSNAINDVSKSSRPISMTSTLIRTLEHLIHSKFTNRLNSQDFFKNIQQFGFRQDHSCADAILQLHHHLFSTVNAGKIAPAAFLDLKKAFDRVDPNQLLHVLHTNAGIKGKAWKWLKAFIFNRRLRVVSQTNAATWHRMEYGVPQGAVLSPLLFLIFIQSAATRILNKSDNKVKMLLYADDLVIFPDIKACGNKKWYSIFQQSLNELSSWASENRMEFNSDKSKVIMFNTKHKMSVDCNYPPFKLSGFDMEFVKVYKYLGIWFQSNLTWTKQHKIASTAAKRAAGLICRTMKRHSPPFYSSIRTMTISYLRAASTYGLEFWSPSERTVRSIQNSLARPLRVSLGLPVTSHQLGTLVETGFPSIRIYREQKQIGLLQRIIHQLPDNHHSKQLIKPFIKNELGTLNSMKNYGKSIKSRPFWICQALNNYCKWFNGQNVNTLQRAVDIKSTALKRTYDEWLSDRNHPTTAPISKIKHEPTESHYLGIDPPATLTLRARLRANRALTQQVCHRFKLNKVPSPICTNSTCINLEDSVHHMLLKCSRHNSARMQLLRLFPNFPRDDGKLFGLLLGERSTHDASFSIPHKLYHHWLKQSGNYLHQIVVDRLGKSGLIGRL